MLVKIKKIRFYPFSADFIFITDWKDIFFFLLIPFFFLIFALWVFSFYFERAKENIKCVCIITVRLLYGNIRYTCPERISLCERDDCRTHRLIKPLDTLINVIPEQDFSHSVWIWFLVTVASISGRQPGLIRRNVFLPDSSSARELLYRNVGPFHREWALAVDYLQYSRYYRRSIDFRYRVAFPPFTVTKTVTLSSAIRYCFQLYC